MPAPQVEAAGGVLWRGDPASPEVALVHRPRYDDWSLPKGKLDARRAPAARRAARDRGGDRQHGPAGAAARQPALPGAGGPQAGPLLGLRGDRRRVRGQPRGRRDLVGAAGRGAGPARRRPTTAGCSSGSRPTPGAPARSSWCGTRRPGTSGPGPATTPTGRWTGRGSRSRSRSVPSSRRTAWRGPAAPTCAAAARPWTRCARAAGVDVEVLPDHDGRRLRRRPGEGGPRGPGPGRRARAGRSPGAASAR